MVLTEASYCNAEHRLLADKSLCSPHGMLARKRLARRSVSTLVPGLGGGLWLQFALGLKKLSGRKSYAGHSIVNCSNIRVSIARPLRRPRRYVVVNLAAAASTEMTKSDKGSAAPSRGCDLCTQIFVCL